MAVVPCKRARVRVDSVHTHNSRVRARARHRTVAAQKQRIDVYWISVNSQNLHEPCLATEIKMRRAQ